MACTALSACGTNAIPAIIQYLHSGNPAVRDAAIEALQRQIGRSISTNEVLRIFPPMLRDSDPMVKLYVATSLGRLGPAASNAVSALAANLLADEQGRDKMGNERVYVRANTALALGQIGPVAVGAVPALTNLLAKGDSYARIYAANALWKITSNETISLPTLMNELSAHNQTGRSEILVMLKEMGPRAKPAFSLLVKEWGQTPRNQIPKDWQAALIAIDPEAAAKVIGTDSAPVTPFKP